MHCKTRQSFTKQQLCPSHKHSPYSSMHKSSSLNPRYPRLIRQKKMTHWTPVQSAHNRDGTPLQTMPDDETE